MPRPAYRSRSRRRIWRRTPGGRLVIHYEKKLGDYPRCAICGKKLHGLPRAKELRRLNLSRKRVTRMYGGHLCSECARKVTRERIFGLIK